MDLKTVFEKAGTKEVAMVRDGNIFYLVLNRENNLFSTDIINKINTALDELDKHEGEAVLVTIGRGDKFFSTGFDLKFWA